MIKVLCGGRFNFPHKGHEYFLKKARKHGDYLVVVIAHDAQNTKRVERVEMEKRKKSIESLKIADEVIIGDSDNFFKVVEKYRPQVIALGWDQELPFDESELKGLGIKVVKIDKLEY